MSKQVWTAYLHADGDDVILPFPEELIEQLGWRVGDVLVWNVDHQTGHVTLTKKNSVFHRVIARIRVWLINIGMMGAFLR